MNMAVQIISHDASNDLGETEARHELTAPSPSPPLALALDLVLDLAQTLTPALPRP